MERAFSLVESESLIFSFPLMWCFQNMLNNLSVIPGKLAIASATRNPTKSKPSGYPLSRV